jgi:hypothetical protein
MAIAAGSFTLLLDTQGLSTSVNQTGTGLGGSAYMSVGSTAGLTPPPVLPSAAPTSP